MANVTYDRIWQDAMSELNEQIHIEDDTLDLEPGEKRGPVTNVSAAEAFQHYASLYIKYLQIFRKLETAYDNMLHPQKRLDVKTILELVQARVVELKHALVRWAPRNPDLNPPKNKLPPFPFPWEYVNLDDIIVDLKLPPAMLEVPVAKYYVEDRQEDLKNRNKLVQGYMNLKLGVDKVFAEMEEDYEDCVPELSLEEAINIIQRNERGRQGKMRAQLVKHVREDEKRQRHFDATGDLPDHLNLDTKTAASRIQKVFRGYMARARAAKAREEELIFIGMKPGPGTESRALKAAHDVARIKRKAEQAENREGYTRAQAELHGVLAEEEGPSMREKLLAERRAWFTEEIGKGVFPESMQAYYDFLKGPEPEADADGKDDGKGKKGKKDAKDKKKDKKDKKGKKGKADEELKPIVPPPLTGPTEFTKSGMDALKGYETTWLDRDETENFAQKHDEDLTKDVIRPNVAEEIRKQVDLMLEDQLANFKKQLAAGGKGKKGKGKKKGKKKGKGGKGKKVKALPGAKACAGMDVDHMLSVLVENKIVNNVRSKSISDLKGSFNYIGSAYQASDATSQRPPKIPGRDSWWIPQDPSFAQVRQNLTEYAVIPLGCPLARKRAWAFCAENDMKPGKSILLYGPRGTGKTTLVEAVANATGALFFNLSPSNLEGKFTDKGGAAMLLHMVFTVAKEPVMGPAVIYIDEAEKICANTGKKKVVNEGPARFKKDLPTYINSLTADDAVIVLGCSREPFLGDEKSFKQCFERFLYIPYPSYPSMVQLWMDVVFECLQAGDAKLPADFDFSSLAHISLGFSCGAIVRAIKSTLTSRRVYRMARRPLSEDEFVNALARFPRTYQDDNEKFREFTAKITGLDAMRKFVRDANDPDAEAKKGKKGAKGKKKK